MQALGSDISPITLSVQNVDQNILRVKMGANGRFEVPGSLFQNTGQGDLSRLSMAVRNWQNMPPCDRSLPACIRALTKVWHMHLPAGVHLLRRQGAGQSKLWTAVQRISLWVRCHTCGG